MVAISNQKTSAAFDPKNIASFQDNIKELDGIGCLPMTDRQFEAMAQRLSDTFCAALEKSTARF